MTVSLCRGRMCVSQDVMIPPELSLFGKARSFPVCGDILRRIMTANIGIELSEDLRDRLRDIKVDQHALWIIKQQDDADGDPRLFSYQRVGVKWLLKIKKGILADDQGLGKTAMAAQACAWLRDRPLNIGIICNGSNISSWASHMVEYFNQGSIWQDKDRGVAVVDHKEFSHTHIVNYDNASALRVFDLDILIVDEAHHIRNRKTQAFKVIRGLAKRVEYLFLLTATPTINADYDMWTLLNLCDPARFSSYWSYIFRFFDVTNSGFGMKIEDVKESEKDNLNRIISTYMLHRDESIKQLPGIKRKRIDYVLTPEHRALYQLMEDEWIASLGETTVKASVKVAQVTRLRQLAISPKLLFVDYSGSDKIDVLVDIMKDGETTVVFTAFEKAARIAYEVLTNNGITVGLLTGSTKNRDEIQDNFGSGCSYQVLVVTHGTGGESLTLTQAKRAILLDLAWHPAGNRSAFKRIYRIGQDEEVEVIMIHSKGTIEDHIEDIIREKGKMSVNELMTRMGRLR